MNTSRNTNSVHRYTNKIFGAFALCAALLTLSSCNVEEFPKPVETPLPGEVNLQLELNFETDMPVYKEIEYTRSGNYVMRYQVNAYREKADGKYEYTKPDKTFTYYNSKLDQLDQIYDITLPEGKYRFVAFADYVDDSSHADLYYNTTNFADIIVNTHPYTGNTDYRDCFNGSQYDNVSEGGLVTVEMKRPVGKYIVIADDVQNFYTRVLEELAQRGEITEAPESPRVAVDLNNYTVKVLYQQFMPSEFNLFSDRPIDSALGVSYEGKLTELNADELQMAFDYVFVNDTETYVDIVIQVIDNTTGEAISTTNSIRVPLIRSHLTIVRGEFLTASADSGMSIDPDFDGEFNIEIR